MRFLIDVESDENTDADDQKEYVKWIRQAFEPIDVDIYRESINGDLVYIPWKGKE